jgi:hypothetical protein
MRDLHHMFRCLESDAISHPATRHQQRFARWRGSGMTISWQ